MAQYFGPNQQAAFLKAMGIDPTNVIAWQLDGGYDRIVEATIQYRLSHVDEDASCFKKYRLVEVQEEIEQPVDGR